MAHAPTLTLPIKADPRGLADFARVVAKHMSAMADDLERGEPGDRIGWDGLAAYDAGVAFGAHQERLRMAKAADDAARCCDMHGRNCEPPSELCCHRCTEANHPRHPRGERCSSPDLSAYSLAEQAKIDAHVAAERDRIRRLAIAHHAHYHACGVPCSAEHSERPFSELIGRES